MIKYIAYLKFVSNTALVPTQLRINEHYAVIQNKGKNIHANILSTKIPLEKDNIKAYKITDFTINGDPNRNQYLWDKTYILDKKICILQKSECADVYFSIYKNKINFIVENKSFIQDLTIEVLTKIITNG